MGPLPSLLRWGAGSPRSTCRGRHVGARAGPRRPGGGRARCRCRSRRRRAARRGAHRARRRGASTWSPRCRPSRTGWPGWTGRWCWATTSTPTARRNVRVSAAVDVLTVAPAGARRTTWRWPSWPRRPTCSRSRAEAVAQSAAPTRAARAAPLAGRPLRTLSARAAAAPQLPARRRSRHQRQPGRRSRARTTRWPSGCSGGGPRSARAAGATVSLNVAPPTRTRSVVKNRALAAAYAGAHRFGVEVFEPATSQHADGRAARARPAHRRRPGHAHPWQDEAHAAAHGGLWRARTRRAARWGWPPCSATGRPGLTSPAQLAGPDSRPDSRGPRTVISTSPAASTRQAQIASPGRAAAGSARPMAWSNRGPAPLR